MDQPLNQPDDQAQREQADKQRRAVETLIAARLKDAVDARSQSGIEQIWLEDEDQYNGIDDVTAPPNARPNGFAATKDGARLATTNRSRVYLNITKPKTDTATSRVSEMLIPTDDKPWEVKPTPIPELSKAVDGADETPVMLADGATAPAKDVAKALMVRAEKAAEVATREATDVATVVLSHLHADHSSGVVDFPAARVVAGEAPATAPSTAPVASVATAPVAERAAGEAVPSTILPAIQTTGRET